MLFLLLLLACTCSGNDPGAGPDSGAGDGGGVEDGGGEGIDADGDGYTVDVDCDDGDPLVHPDAEERWGDGVDQDCDGVEVGCAGVNLAAGGGGRILGDAAGAWTGHSLGRPPGWTEGSSDLVVIGSPGMVSTGGLANAGAVLGVSARVFLDREDDVTLVSDWRIDGPNELAGLGAEISVGDVDHDGVQDVVVSGARLAGEVTYPGVIWIMHGPISQDMTVNVLNDTAIEGSWEWNGLGLDLKYSNDATGDELPDVIATWSGHCDDVAGAGGFHVLYDRLDHSRTVDANDPRYDVPEMCWSDGADLAVLDLDGDGIDDAALGAKFGGSVISHVPGGYQRDTLGPGYVYLQLGPLTAGGSLEDADATLVGPSSNSLFGRAVAEGGDLDGDGADDLLVGAPWGEADLSNTGIAWAVSGRAAVQQAMSEPETSAIATFKGDQPKDLQLGYGLSTGGDMDGDGSLEVLAVAQAQETGSIYSARGKVYVFRGPVSGTLVSGDAWLRVDGEAGGDHLGYYDAAGGSIFGGFDVNADGFDDFVAGAELYDRDQIGAAYLFYGGTWE